MILLVAVGALVFTLMYSLYVEFKERKERREGLECKDSTDCGKCLTDGRTSGNNCYWCSNGNAGKGGCYDANNDSTCPDYTEKDGGCISSLCNSSSSRCGMTGMTGLMPQRERRDTGYSDDYEGSLSAKDKIKNAFKKLEGDGPAAYNDMVASDFFKS
jgi:hypothetical protein